MCPARAIQPASQQRFQHALLYVQAFAYGTLEQTGMPRQHQFHPFFCKREEKVTLSRRQVNLLKEAKTLHAAAAACWPFILFLSLILIIMILSKRIRGPRQHANPPRLVPALGHSARCLF
uniref:(northern house mosquito) hypothetical protein n=1 Tax=Culex pipiens TaxID=7175 RepID=A0A8D8FF26_CULPI